MARPDRDEADQRHALKLAETALSMPHGDKRSVIKALLALPLSTLEKRELLMSLARAGETISADTVLDGLRELLEASKAKPWLLDEQHNGIERWIELLAFSDNPAAVDDALALVDMRFREPWRLRWLLSALGKAPDVQAEQLLWDLANRDSRFYSEYEWQKAVISRGTPKSAKMILDLICDGKLTENKREIDGRRLARDLVSMIRNLPGMRSELFRCYEGQVAGIAKSVIENAIANLADPEGLLAMVRRYARDKRNFDGMLHRMIEEIVLGKQSLSEWGGYAYEIYSVNAATLRKRLFALIDCGPEGASVAGACLTAIDELRDEHGWVDSEPRHPDIASGRPWPLVRQG